MTRILLVDDHPVVRHGLRQVLASADGDVAVEEAGNADEAIDRLRTVPCDIVVLDITLPGRSGLDLLKELRRDRPALPVLVLSMHPASEFARRVLSAGASGYLTKNSAPGELARAIARIRAGQRYISPEVPDHQRDGSKLPHECLSDREYQVLRMLAGGKPVSKIAHDLSLSVKSVSTYRARILRKMGFKTNGALMRYAMSNNLVD